MTGGMAAKMQIVHFHFCFVVIGNVMKRICWHYKRGVVGGEFPCFHTVGSKIDLVVLMRTR